MTAPGAPVLNLAEPAATSARKAGKVRRVAVALAAVGALFALGHVGGAWQVLAGYLRGGEQAPAVAVSPDQAKHVSRLTVDNRAEILSEGDDALARNAEIPFVHGKAAPMRAFLLHASPAASATALKCLTQAIYYEAANEPLEGRRAVAQVVLNRVRHPAYPKSVCGVVYQGAERTTGCQFSFTCDGSLLRAPMARQWGEAQEIAREALGGKVEAKVGTATHYHADYVLPKWAFELAKVSQLGRHLFYRFEGAWGRPASFTGHYSAREVIPALDFARLSARLAAGSSADALAFVPGLTVAPHVTDRHAANDVGGRIDVTREWRPSIPDPTTASSRYRALIGDDAGNGPAGDEDVSNAAPAGAAEAPAAHVLAEVSQ